MTILYTILFLMGNQCSENTNEEALQLVDAFFTSLAVKGYYEQLRIIIDR